MGGLPMTTREAETGRRAVEALSQWQLIARRFRRHHLARASVYLLALLYAVALLAELVAPYTVEWRDLDHAYAPPQLLRFSFVNGLHTFAMVPSIDPVTLRRCYTEDRRHIVPLSLFVRGPAYRLFGLVSMDRHLLGVDHSEYSPPESLQATGSSVPQPTLYLLGADRYGRDVMSRIIYGARISLSIGVVSIVATFVLGVFIGGVSGYVGGAVDNVIQRTIDVINAFPQLPLWLALGASLPPEWSPVAVYFSITIVLSLLGWTGLARVVRGKILALREEDYAMAARLLGASHGRILFRHLLPGFTSHIIVTLTLTVPGMILGETALSFLGLGLRPPIVSWGVMTQDCMNISAVADYPWLLMPVFFIIVTVLSFNFVGDGLRDAADPYASL